MVENWLDDRCWVRFISENSLYDVITNDCLPVPLLLSGAAEEDEDGIAQGVHSGSNEEHVLYKKSKGVNSAREKIFKNVAWGVDHALLSQFGRISLYVTDDAIEKLYAT